MRKLLLTRDGRLEIMPPRARFAGPEKPQGVPRRTWESLFAKRTSAPTRLTAALAVVQLLTTADAGYNLHTVLDVQGLQAARAQINAWARWNPEHGGPVEGNRQLGVEGEDSPAEVVGLDDGVALEFEQAARAAGFGLIEWLISCGIAELDSHRSDGAAG